MLKTKKNIIINIILLLAVTIILFIFLEIIFRAILGPGRIQNSKGETPYINDPELGFKLKPYYSGNFKEPDFNTEFKTNAQGFRNNFDFEKSDKKIIFMLGDSFIAGSGVEVEETSSLYLKNILADYKVYNLGVPGYSQRQHIIQLEKFIPIYNPEIIILNFYTGNDLTDNCDSLPSIKSPEKLLEKIRMSIRKSQFITFIYRKLVVPFKYPKNLDYYIDSPKIQECYDITKQHLIKIKNLTSKYNTKLIMTLIPREPQTVKEKEEELIDWYDNFPEFNPKKFDLNLINKKMSNICKEIGLDCLDFSLRFKEDSSRDLYLNDGHWNKSGHKLAAETIAKYLKDGGYLENYE